VEVSCLLHTHTITTIDFVLNRCVDEHRMWYEWSIVEPVVTPIHNLYGRFFAAGY
jgi:hypothetical protein